MLAKSIAEFYADKIIFVTGATGLLGKSVIEKLLRSCKQVRCIYVLIRPKRGHSVEERLNKLLDCELFNLIRQENPDQLNKIKAVEGDVAQKNFGLSDSSVKIIIKEVSVVVHAAATVRFNEPLKLAVGMNLVPVLRLIEIAKKMERLEVLIHVSTAYANCDEEIVQECIYPPSYDPNKLIEVTDCLTEDMLSMITPQLIGTKPNTYTFTKQLAEYVVSQNVDKLPLVIVRPSIIGSSVAEPFPGWIDNFNAATGLIAAISKGMLRSMMGDYEKSANIIPVDTTANFIIAVGWYSAGTHKIKVDSSLSTTSKLKPLTNGHISDDTSTSEEDSTAASITVKDGLKLINGNVFPETLQSKLRTPTVAVDKPTLGEDVDINETDYTLVYNVTLDNDKLTWGTFVKALLPRIQHMPSVSCHRLPNFHMTTAAWYHDLKWTFSHIIPAAAFDLFLLLQGKSPLYLRNIDRLKDTIVRLSYFTLNHWYFVNDNKNKVLSLMSDQDKTTFNFELNNVDWVSYLNVYHHGTKTFALKEKPDTNQKSMSHGKRLRILHFAMRYLPMLIVLFYMMGKMHAFHGLFYQLLRVLINIIRLLRV